jgi:tetratricopeptide (TPR) repeat protein
MFRMSFFALTLLLSISQIKSNPVSKKDMLCKYSNEEITEMTVFPDFYLSMALKFQSYGNRTRIAEEKEMYHKESIQYYQKYIQCLNSFNNSISALTYFNKTLSHFELSEWDQVNTNLDNALSQDSRMRDALILKARLLIKENKKNDALNLLEESISYFGDDSDMLFLLAGLSADLNNIPKALLYYGSLWNSIQKKDGDIRYRPYVLKNLSDLHHKRNDSLRSIYYLKQYLKYRPNDEDSTFQLANYLSQNGYFKESRELLQGLQKKNPNNHMYFFLMAEIYFIENPKEALRYFTYLDQMGILNKNVYLTNLYRLLQGKNNLVGPYFKNLSKKNSNRLSLFIALSMIYEKEKAVSEQLETLKRTAMIAYAYKQYNLSIQYSKKFIIKSEKNQDANKEIPSQYDFIANCYEELQSPQMAILNVQKAIEKTNNEKEKNQYLLHYANLLRHGKLKKYKESVSILHSILDSDPGLLEVYQSLGMSFFLMEKYRESVDYFTRALEIDDKNPQNLYLRASSYEKIGYMEDTIYDLKKLIEIDSSNSVAYNFLGYLYAEKNIELEESQRLIQKALDLEPDNAAYQDSLGWVYYKIGKFEEALHHLILARQLMEEKKEEDPTVYDHLGDVFLKNGNLESARENWELAMKLYKNKEDSLKVKEKIKKIEKFRK